MAGRAAAGERGFIRRLIGSVLLLVAGVCSEALVFFPTDVNGAGQFGMSQHTPIGVTHVVFATTGFLTVLTGMALLTATWGQAVLHAVALFGFAGILGWALVGTAGEAAVRPAMGADAVADVHHRGGPGSARFLMLEASGRQYLMLSKRLGTDRMRESACHAPRPESHPALQTCQLNTIEAERRTASRCLQDVYAPKSA